MSAELVKTSEPKSLAPTRFTAADSRALKALELSAGGRDGLARLLLFLPAPSAPQLALLSLLEHSDSRPLTALLREVGLSPAVLATSVVTGKMEFEREVARASAVEAMPDVVDDLRKHAIDGMWPCSRGCYKPAVGIKTVVRLGTEEVICPACNGAGQTLQSSPHKQWAAGLLGRISNLPEEKGCLAVNVNTNVGVKVDGAAGNYMEKLAKAVHKVMGETTPIIEAEVVSSTPNKS